MTDHKCVRWGFLSTANIARKNWKSVRMSGNGTLVAVASRQIASAEAFIASMQGHVPFPEAPEALGSYEALLARTDIDAVYIPLPTGLRKEWVIKAAEAGKHVLCEKPCAINAEDLREMIAACERHEVQFMDGVMYMHTKRMKAMREVLDQEKDIGAIRRIASQFSFCAPEAFFKEDIRSQQAMEPAGCLGDLGWYTIRFSLWAMRYEMPQRVRATMLQSVGDGINAVPTEISAELFFADGVTATFYNSFVTEMQQWANISGKRGNLTVNDFVLPYCGNSLTFTVSNPAFVSEGGDFAMERHERQVTSSEYGHGHRTAQETNLFRHFGDIVLADTREQKWPQIALKTQIVLDACLTSAREGGRLVELS